MKQNHRPTLHATALCLAMTSLAYATAATPVGSEHYSYDASGNMTEKTINGQTTKMAYTGNRITGTATADSKSAYDYDQSGRPTTIADRQMTYGYENKVLTATTNGQTTELLYNAEGHLVAKSTNGKASTYSWDGIALAAQDGQAFANEVHISGGIPVIQGTDKVVVSDYLGTTMLLGKRNFVSTAFGEGLEEVRFTSKPFSDVLDSFLFPARLYSASTGRWSVADPSGFPDGANNLSYVNNEPISNLDPEGLLINSFPKNSIAPYDLTIRDQFNAPFCVWTVQEHWILCDDGLTTITGFKKIADVQIPPGHDPTYNCYAYSLGTQDIWMDDFEKGLKGDKWRLCPEQYAMIARYQQHASLVTSMTNNMTMTVHTTSSKNGALVGPTSHGRSHPLYGDPNKFYEK